MRTTIPFLAFMLACNLYGLSQDQLGLSRGLPIYNPEVFTAAGGLFYNPAVHDLSTRILGLRVQEFYGQKAVHFLQIRTGFNENGKNINLGMAHFGLPAYEHLVCRSTYGQNLGSSLRLGLALEVHRIGFSEGQTQLMTASELGFIYQGDEISLGGVFQFQSSGRKLPIQFGLRKSFDTNFHLELISSSSNRTGPLLQVSVQHDFENLWVNFGYNLIQNRFQMNLGYQLQEFKLQIGILNHPQIGNQWTQDFIWGFGSSPFS